ncbi:MAG TPA: aspartate aminotransferase family protein, partial [Microthrixaceae bacterium]|nr:aspartate aminotransferase family protein [Microthrixaceae bacterium]
AGLTVLEHLTPAAFAQLDATAARLAIGLQDAFDQAGVAAVVPRVGPLIGLFFGAEAPVDYDGAKRSVDLGCYPTFFHSMIDDGIALAPGPYEVLFPSLAHRDDDIDATLAAARRAAVAVAATLHGKDRP